MGGKFSAGLDGGRCGHQPRKERRNEEESGLEGNHVDGVLMEIVGCGTGSSAII